MWAMRPWVSLEQGAAPPSVLCQRLPLCLLSPWWSVRPTLGMGQEALGVGLQRLRGCIDCMLPAPGSPGGAEGSLSGLAGSEKGFRKQMGARAAQPSPLKA